ncbi:hypothetical protein [Pseudohongiella nitratireducens]|uniref:hypothetical protein n=1 Tax=Pseudohongiella nitratireducens TaxID=1768907 RepID=UPI0037CA9779
MTAILLTFGWIIERAINNRFIQQDVDELNAVVQALIHSLKTVPTASASQLSKSLWKTLYRAGNRESYSLDYFGAWARRKRMWLTILSR